LRDVYIIEAIRTPIGKFGKSLARFSAVELGEIIVRALFERVSIDKDIIDFLIMGQVIRSGSGMDPARQVSLRAGIPKEIDAMTVDMVCASGMAAIITGASMIKANDADIIIAGGMESMSRAPFIISWEYRWGVKLLYGTSTPIIDTLVFEGLTDPFNGLIMAQEADMLAKEMGVERIDLEKIALESHRRAYNATEKNLFKDELIPVTINENMILDRDEGIRGDTTLEKMSRLPTIFPDGLHTAATSSQISDGSAVVLLASEDAVSKYDLAPKGKILGYSWSGTDTWKFPLAPIYSIKKLLNRTSIAIDEIDVFENNEAFAISTIVLQRKLDIPFEKINKYGGAIALGHPLGASGARITATLLNVLRKNGGKYGIASICHGMGGATSILIELVE
jgi:acetyl-CoA C-acetyltransferase